jgi:tryptophan 2,3-dioxygenase
MTDQQEKLTYGGYLRLDQLLTAQQPRSAEHDEMLFIVIHQVYELWFKQLLHELARLQKHLEAGDTTHSMRTLRRCLAILKIVVQQLDVLETMTPTQFRKFRDALGTSSGFESIQFRELEATLGRRDFPKWAPQPQAAGRPSLFDSFLAYLGTQGYDVPEQLRERDVTQAVEPSDAMQQTLKQVYDDDSGAVAVSELLLDLDEGMQEWRYRHVKMVERTIGMHSGTGGSTGATYLAGTVGKPTFPDLWAVRNIG